MAAKKKGKKRTFVRKGRRRLYSTYRMDPALRRFRTFQHDFQTVLETAARSELVLSPADLVGACELAAKKMADAIEARRPTKDPAMLHYNRRSLRRSPWMLWQSLFDRMVHTMSERTTLTPLDVVTRAEDIADCALKVLVRRAPRKGSSRPRPGLRVVKAA